MMTKRRLLALAAATTIGLGTGYAALAADPHHGHAVDHANPALAALHERMMGLAVALAHGADLAQTQAKIPALAAEYVAITGKPQEQKAMEEHMLAMSRQIVAAREQGPEALHKLLMEIHGGEAHH